jgi:superfamily II DNA or RNA helicase
MKVFDIPSGQSELSCSVRLSHHIFVQQLGRGLRKAEDKDYSDCYRFHWKLFKQLSRTILTMVIVLNKDTLRKLISTGSN